MDYSNSKVFESNVFNIIPHPDGWMVNYPNCILMLDPPTSKRNGSWRFDGILKNRASINQYYLELFYQNQYFKDKPEAFIKKYKLSEQNSDPWFSFIELIAVLKSQQAAITLHSLIRSETNGQFEHVKLGQLIANAKLDRIDDRYQKIILTGNWFMKAVGIDNTYLKLCPVCDWKSETYNSLSDIEEFCPNCHFGLQMNH